MQSAKQTIVNNLGWFLLIGLLIGAWVSSGISDLKARKADKTEVPVQAPDTNIGNTIDYNY